MGYRSDGLEHLRHFVNDDAYLYAGKLYGEEDVIYFDGMMDATLCEDLAKRDEYIKNIIAKKLLEFEAERR